MYVFVGKDPIPPHKDAISMENLSKNRLHLKFKQAQDGSPKGPVSGGMNYNPMPSEPIQSKPLGGN